MQRKVGIKLDRATSLMYENLTCILWYLSFWRLHTKKKAPYKISEAGKPSSKTPISFVWMFEIEVVVNKKRFQMCDPNEIKERFFYVATMGNIVYSATGSSQVVFSWMLKIILLFRISRTTFGNFNAVWACLCHTQKASFCSDSSLKILEV